MFKSLQSSEPSRPALPPLHSTPTVDAYWHRSLQCTEQWAVNCGCFATAPHCTQLHPYLSPPVASLTRSAEIPLPIELFPSHAHPSRLYPFLVSFCVCLVPAVSETALAQPSPPACRIFPPPVACLALFPRSGRVCPGKHLPCVNTPSRTATPPTRSLLTSTKTPASDGYPAMRTFCLDSNQKLWAAAPRGQTA